MNNITGIEKNIYKLYDNQTYLDKYGGSYYGSIFILIIAFLVIGYLIVKINLIPIQKKWPQNKCNPVYIPFAGIIAKPPNQGVFEFTATNFSMCINQILETIVHNYTKPVNSVVNMLLAIFKSLMKVIAIIKALVYKVKNIISSMIQAVWSRIVGAITPFLIILMKVKDLVKKAGATVGIVFLKILSWYYSLKAWTGVVIFGVIKILIAAAILIVLLFVSIIGIPAAIVGTKVWVVCAVLLAIVVGYMTYILSLTKVSMPSKPQRPKPPDIWPFCFAPDTPVNMNDGTTKKMQDIEIGEILENNNEVISVLQIKGSHENPFYEIESDELNYHIYVTGTHKIYHPENNKLIMVQDYENSEKTIFWAPIMYCLITKNHTIPIGEYTFHDWED